MLLLDRGVAKKALSISKSTLFKLKLSENDIIQWNKVIEYCKAISVVHRYHAYKHVYVQRICLIKLIFTQLLNFEYVLHMFIMYKLCLAFIWLRVYLKISRIASCVSNWAYLIMSDVCTQKIFGFGFGFWA